MSTPIIPPIAAPNTPSRSAIWDQVDRGETPQVTTDGEIYRTTYGREGDDLVIRIPMKGIPYQTLRRKDEVNGETGKRVISATLVVSASAAPGANFACEFPNPKNGTTIHIDVKPSLNLNLPMNWKTLQVIAPSSEPSPVPAQS